MADIFISYSHADKKILEELQLRFRPYSKIGLRVNVWSDKQLKPGDIWEKEIVQALRRAKVVVAIVSPSFLASDFINRVEMPRTLRKVKLKKGIFMPLLAKPTNIKVISWLRKFQIEMRDGDAFSELERGKKDRFLNEFVDKVLEKIGIKQPAFRSKERSNHKNSNSQLQKPTIFETAHAGFIIIANISGFSDIEAVGQHEVIGKIWHFLHHQNIKFLNEHKAVVHLFADQVMLAFPNNQKKMLPHEKIVELATNLLNAMKPQGISIGIHEGMIERTDFGGHVQVYGCGVNDCEKLRRLGSAGSILVSENFISAWCNEIGPEKVTPQFDPKEEALPLLKRRLPELKYRILLHPGAQVKTPCRIALGLVIDGRIRQTLESMEASFVSAMRTLDEAFSADSLSTRVSLFAPVQMPDSSKCLCSTVFRFHKQHQFIQKGNTTYSIEGDGEGPAGRAFVSNSPQVLHDLPDFSESQQLYVQKLQETGLSTEKIVGFGRKPRAFFDFPFSISGFQSDDDSAQLNGVICIDCSDPLSKIDVVSLQKVIKQIQDDHADDVALLWALRQRA